MFNFCILKKWLIFFMWYFTIIALWWKVYFIVAVFCKNWVLYYGLSWSLNNTLCCWRQQCVLQLFGSIPVCLQSSSFFFFISLDLLLAVAHFSPSVLRGCLSCTWEFCYVHACSQWLNVLIDEPLHCSHMTPINFSESLFFVCACLF